MAAVLDTTHPARRFCVGACLQLLLAGLLEAAEANAPAAAAAAASNSCQLAVAAVAPAAAVAITALLQQLLLC